MLASFFNMFTRVRKVSYQGVYATRFVNLPDLKPCFAFLVNQFNINVVDDGMIDVQFGNHLSQTCML